MKKLILLSVILISIVCFTSCEKYDNDKELRGKTFTYNNGYTGKYRIISTYIFKMDGHIIWESTVGNSEKATFEHLKYRLDGSNLVIYRDNHNYWKKEAQNKVSASGTYHGSYIIISDLKHILK